MLALVREMLDEDENLTENLPSNLKDGIIYQKLTEALKEINS